MHTIIQYPYPLIRLLRPGQVVFTFFLILFSYSAPALAVYQSHGPLYEQVLNHLKQKADQQLFNAKFKVQKISKHIKFPVCSEPLELTDKHPEKIAGRNTFKITCNQPRWNLYMISHTKGDLPVVVSTKGILKQAVIKPGDIKRILVPYQKANRHAFTEIDQLIGMRAKRRISPNKILTLQQVQPPFWVFKNRHVKIVSKANGIQIEVTGVALSSGVEQDQVKVKNLSSKKKIVGIVIAPNTVWVP